jgi:mannosyl-oligosaccharide alpha-1,3-glucosidase
MRLQLGTDRPSGQSLAKILTSTLLLLNAFDTVVAVKRDNFKTCSQSGFCKRNRALADEAAAAGVKWDPSYEIDTKSIRIGEGQFRANIEKTVEEGVKIELPVVISFLQNGGARVQLDEKRRQEGKIELRNDSKARKERYNEAGKWALINDPEIDEQTEFTADDGLMKVQWSVWQNDATIGFKPFEVKFNRGGETHVILNERHLLNVEHWRPKPEGDENCDSCWDETFGGNTDSKPRGR